MLHAREELSKAKFVEINLGHYHDEEIKLSMVQGLDISHNLHL